MKIRSLVILIGLATGLALPTFAQQKDTVDSQTAAKIDALSAKYDQTMDRGDAAAMAALFTDDGVYVTERGPLNGREAIKDWYAGLYQPSQSGPISAGLPKMLFTQQAPAIRYGRTEPGVPLCKQKPAILFK